MTKIDESKAEKCQFFIYWKIYFLKIWWSIPAPFREAGWLREKNSAKYISEHCTTEILMNLSKIPLSPDKNQNYQQRADIVTIFLYMTQILFSRIKRVLKIQTAKKFLVFRRHIWDLETCGSFLGLKNVYFRTILWLSEIK